MREGERQWNGESEKQAVEERKGKPGDISRAGSIVPAVHILVIINIILISTEPLPGKNFSYRIYSRPIPDPTHSHSILLPSFPHLPNPQPSLLSLSPMAALRRTKPIKWTYPLTPTQVQTLIRSEPDTQKALLIFDSATAEYSNGYRHDLPTFLLLIHRLAAANLLKPVEQLLSRIPPELRQPAPESAFLPLLRAYGRAHKPLESLRLFRLMRSHHHVGPTHRSYNALLAVLVAENQLKLAKEIYNEMKEAGIKPTVASYNVLIKALCGNEKTLDTAVRVFRKMESPDACTYGTLIDGLSKNGRLCDAHKLFDEMGDRKIEPTVVTFTSFIHGLCRAGRLHEALEVFDEMGKRGIRPNVVTYSCLLDGLCKGGRAMKAMGLLDRMVKDRCLPNVISYSSLINGLCKEGRVWEASEVLDRMRLQGKKPDAGLYGKIIDGLCELGKVNEAANFLDEMVLSGVSPNRVTWSLHVRINNMVVRGLCDKGELSRGFRVYQSMRTRGISIEPESFELLVGCYCKKRDVHKAAKIVEEMLIEGCVPDQDTWNIVMGGYLGRRKVREEAELMWNELVGEDSGSCVLNVESKS